MDAAMLSSLDRAYQSTIAVLQRTIDGQRDAIKRVLEIHQASDKFDGFLCDACTSVYPCPTVNALEGR